MIFNRHHLQVAFAGLVVITLYKFFFTSLPLPVHFVHEVSLLLNLLGLLVGFELMADQFKRSRLADKVPAFLADDWKGGFMLLCMIFALSIILDNIAAAIIGATLARVVFQDKVRVGHLAAIVAAK